MQSLVPRRFESISITRGPIPSAAGHTRYERPKGEVLSARPVADHNLTSAYDSAQAARGRAMEVAREVDFFHREAPMRTSERTSERSREGFIGYNPTFRPTPKQAGWVETREEETVPITPDIFPQVTTLPPVTPLKPELLVTTPSHMSVIRNDSTVPEQTRVSVRTETRSSARGIMTFPVVRGLLSEVDIRADEKGLKAHTQSSTPAVLMSSLTASVEDRSALSEREEREAQKASFTPWEESAPVATSTRVAHREERANPVTPLLNVAFEAPKTEVTRVSRKDTLMDVSRRMHNAPRIGVVQPQLSMETTRHGKGSEIEGVRPRPQVVM